MIKKAKKTYFKDDSFLKQVGNKIRACRIARKFSIEDLANECDMDYSQLARMELGKINFSISFLTKIAKPLKIDPKDLLP